MDVKFLSPFVEAAKEVIQAEANTSLQRGELSLQHSALTTKEVSVLISLIGEVEGVVIYSLSSSTATGIVSQVIGQEFQEFDELAQSGIAEMGNVITGRATMMLSKTGFSADISPPTVIVGEGVQISTVDFTRIVVPLFSSLGEITVHLSLHEKNNRTSSSNFVPAQLDQDALERANKLNS
jgi:chemotaxis protein CheX